MTNQIKNFINESEKEFEEKFKSYIKIISVGQYDEKGVNIGFLPADEVIKQFISSRQISLIKMIVESLENYDLSVMGEDYKAGFKKCIELLK